MTTKLDEWMSALAEGAEFGDGAVARLERRLASEAPPLAARRRRRWAASLAVAAVATASGALLGGLAEARQEAPAEAMLPASQDGTAAALLFGEI